MATITVDYNLDPFGRFILLRDAVRRASDGDTITFDPQFAGQRLIAFHTLEIDKALTIDGDLDDDGRPDVLLSGDQLQNDVLVAGADFITDAAASLAAGTLADNVQLIAASAPLTIDGLILTGGGNPSLSGGAIFTSASLTVTHSILAGNSAFTSGAIASTTDGFISDSAIFGNVSTDENGAVLFTGRGLLTNVTVSGNQSNGFVGAVHATGGLTLVNSTVTGNAGSSMGAVTSFQTLDVVNSLILGNSGADVWSSASVVYHGLNIVGLGQDVDPGDGVINAAALQTVFAAVGADPTTGVISGVLADNGGSVPTVALRASLSNPAIDQADGSVAPSTDGRGFARYDTPGIAGVADIGAFEAQSVGLPANTVPGAQTVLEDGSLVFSGLSAIRVSQPDDRPLSVTLAVQHGMVTLASLANLTVTGGANGSGSITLQGAVADLNAALAGLTYAPAANYHGPDELRVTTSDGAAVDVDTVPITVTSVNDAPAVVALIPGLGIPEDSPVRFAVPAAAFTDADGDALTYSATLEDGSDLPSWLGFDPATLVFSGTPPADLNGAIGLKLTASDGQATASVIFGLTLLPVNDAPVLAGSVPDQTLAEDSLWSYRVPADLFSDVDADTILFSAALADGSSLPSWIGFDPATRTFYGSPPQDFNGSLDLRVTGSDGALSASDVFTLTYTPVNDAPVVAANYAGVGIVEDTPLSFALGSGGFSDPDGDPLTYSATLSDGSTLPSWLAFDPATRTFTGTPPANFNGPLGIKVTVSDGQASAFQTFDLQVVPANDAPVLVGSVPDQSSPEDTPWSYQVAANLFADVDGDAIVFSALLGDGSALPAWLAFDPATRTFAGTPPADFEGTIELAVTGSDGRLSATDRFILTVTPAEDAPRAVSDLVAVFENETKEANVLANDVEVDVGQTLRVVAVSGPSGSGTVGRELAGLYGSLTLQADGSYSYAARNTPLPEGATATETFSYTVDDGHGGTSTADIVVTVTGSKPLPPGDGTVRGTIGSGWVSEGTGDFDADGNTDFLWRNTTTNAVELWTTGAIGGVVRTSLGTVGANWTFETTGNLDGRDGDDVVLRDATTGATGAWIMRDGRPSDWRDLGNLDATWRIRGAGDLDGSGSDDLVLFQHTSGVVEAWYQSPTGPGVRTMLGTIFAGSQVVGIGDLDGDGRDDVLLYNFSTRKIGAWDMSEGRPGGWFDYGVLNAGWEVTGIGNLDGAGPDDIGFYNDTTGEDGAWSMVAGHISDWLPEPVHDDLDPIGVGRLGTAAEQIFWLNPVTGAVLTF